MSPTLCLAPKSVSEKALLIALGGKLQLPEFLTQPGQEYRK